MKYAVLETNHGSSSFLRERVEWWSRGIKL